MKKIVILLLVFVIAACSNHEKKKQALNGNEKNDTIIKPNTKWDVRKEYDEFGNLIKYDSLYTYSYSNVNGDSIHVNLDSIMYTFRKYFDDSSPFEGDEYLRYFPKYDSLFMNDFFKEDYFFKNWESHQFELEDIIKRMDSSRNMFLKKFHPDLMESNKKI